MTAHGSPRDSVEQKGLLRDSFDGIDDVEVLENGHANGHGHHRRRKSRSGDDWYRSRKIWSSASAWIRPRNLLIAVVVLIVLGGIGALWHRSPVVTDSPETPVPQKPKPSQKPKPKPIPVAGGKSSSVSPWKKPSGFKVIGLIFFGRQRTVEILDCYLKRNLVSNGGFLDEVLWVANTDNEDDLAYMDKLVKTSALYKSLTLINLGYDSVWEHAVDDKNMFIKIDDDMVYFSDNAIPDIVYTKLKHPETLDVVANLVNSPETGWLHYHVGAIHAYLPEMTPPKDQKPAALGPKAWRASALPKWEGDDMEFPLGEKGTGGEILENDAPGAPPFKGHRWLPLKDQGKNLYNTPISHTQYDAYGPDWTSWALAAQVQYSLLENIENDQLDKYHYGGGLDLAREGIWDMKYGRMNINFMAIWGKDVLDAVPFEDTDDEHFLSETLTRRLDRPLYVNTHAIAAHFSFRTQHEIFDSDLLSRWRAYANEKICTKENQISTS